MVDHLYKLVFSKNEKIYSLGHLNYRQSPSYAQIKQILDRVIAKINAFNKIEPTEEKKTTNGNKFVEIDDEGGEDSFGPEMSPSFNETSFEQSNSYPNGTMSESDASFMGSGYANYSAVSNNSDKRKSVYENKENQLNKAKRAKPVTIRPRATVNL